MAVRPWGAVGCTVDVGCSETYGVFAQGRSCRRSEYCRIENWGRELVNDGSGARGRMSYIANSNGVCSGGLFEDEFMEVDLESDMIEITNNSQNHASLSRKLYCKNLD